MLKDRIKEFNDKASWLRNGVVYHRGKHDDNVKENTIEAFELAIRDNLAIELDIRVTKDDKVVVSHDSSLKRVFGIDVIVEENNYEDIKKYGVPLLSDVFNLVNDKIGLMIEIKDVEFNKLYIIYNLLKDYKGRYCIVSFNPMILKYFRKKDSSIIRGQLSYHFKDTDFNCLFKFLLRNMWFNIFSKPHFISYGIDDYNHKLLNKYRKKGYFIIGWTYKSEKNKFELKKIYDNMIVEGISTKEF